jgi:2-polyprenyl-3-methyl-5-hydroxy-6-metoxy-1,4-benzoquinol methylase
LGQLMRGRRLFVAVHLGEDHARRIVLVLQDVETQHAGLGQGCLGVELRGSQEVGQSIAADPDMDVHDKHAFILLQTPSAGRRAPELCDDVRVTDEVLADQVDYYRRRAGEYDVTAYGDVPAARTRIARLVAAMRPAGNVLEIACGTGLWTEALAGWADTVTAVDTAPEAVALARDRVRQANVSFEVADVFSWDARIRFDVIFFSAWLSHVPASRFGRFWQLLGSLLADNGRVLFIDEHVDVCGKEAYVAGCDEVVERRLEDGSTFRVIKNFVDPQELELRLGRLGWDCTIRRDGSDWVYGEARRPR